MLMTCRVIARIVLCTVLLSCAPVSSSDPPSPRRGAGRARGPDVRQALRDLHTDHPRLLATQRDFDEIARLCRDDPLMKRWHRDLQDQADRILAKRHRAGAGAGEAESEGDGNALQDARRLIGHAALLSAMFRLTGNKEYAERARQELLEAAAMPDWQPARFLVTAETTAGMAIGYDWLFDYLGKRDRNTIRAAIIRNGLEPGLAAYEKRLWWTNEDSNWSLVCNSGMGLGALAVADTDPELAEKILGFSSTNILNGLRKLAPDGGWEEGPVYWNYGTRYATLYMAALRTSLGTDLGLRDVPGLAKAGDFRIHFVGPTGKGFNFSDSPERPGLSPQMLWWAREFDRPIYAGHEIELARGQLSILHLLWVADVRSAKWDEGYPLCAMFRGVEVAFFRSDWHDPRATWVGFKGGDAKANHGHLDLGSFVLESGGQRWALDLGPDDYNLPDYWGKKRWTYYRLKTEGHNTLTLDGENQETEAHAEIVAFSDKPKRGYAVVDLADAYRGQARKALRGIELLNGNQVLVQDELEARNRADVTWNFHTLAKITIADDGATAVMQQEDAKLVARILEPAGARFEVISANPRPPQAQQPDVRNLVIRLRGVRQTRIVVLLSPPTVQAVPPVRPLSEWIAGADAASVRPARPGPAIKR